jgi:cytochrome c oxidase subunit 3
LSTPTSAQGIEAHAHRDDEGSRLGMWLFLFTELLLFGGMFLVYAVYKFTYPEQFHIASKELNTLFGALNTIILLTSSLTIVLSIVAIKRGQRLLSIFFQLMTLAMGLGFLVNKFFEWSAKISHGIYPGSDKLLEKESGEILFFGLYYVMTGLHGLHIVIGMIVIAFMTWQTIKNKINQDQFVRLESAGLYWHLVDVIWIFLFPLFYLIS